MPDSLAIPVTVSRSSVLSTAIAETAHHLEIGPSELGKIIGISQPVASRLLNGAYAIREGTKEWELGALFVRLYRGLFAIVGSDDQLAKDWLRSANKAFDGQKPLGVIKSVQGLVQACEYVDAHRATV